MPVFISVRLGGANLWFVVMTGPGLTRSQSAHCLMMRTDWRIFFHAAEVAVVTVAVDADRDVEIHLVVHFIRLFLTHVPLHARTAQHHAGKAFLHGALGRDNADADGTLFPDAVVGQEGFECIDVFWEALAEGVDEVEHGAFAGFVELLQYFGVAEFAALVFGHKVGQVAVNAAGTEVGGVHTRAGNGFVQVISSSRSRKA